MDYLAYIILGLMLLGLVLLAAPISLGYDSTDKWFKVKWLGLTVTKRLGTEKPEKFRKIAKKQRKVGGRRLMGRLWQRRELVSELISRVGRFVLEVGRTFAFRDCEAGLSLPDPMCNGVLYGILTNIDLGNVTLSVNFENRNYAKFWVTVYPYRVAGKLAVLLLRLPYLQMFRFAWDLRKPN